MADTDSSRSPEPKPRRLVVFNADDFGYTRGINEAVRLAHQNGLLKSASLMATGSAFDEAVGLAHALDGFETGIHLCATQTRSLLPARLLKDLVDENGWFRHSLASLGARLLFSDRLVDQVTREWRAQIEKILAAGLKPDHMNAHQHLHMHPRLFERVLALADEHGIPLIRLAHTNYRLTSRLDRRRLLQKSAKAAVFTALRWSCGRTRSIDRYSVCIADHTYGLLQVGRMDETYLLKLLPRLPAGFSEIYVHPGLRTEACSPHIPRQAELAALLSPRVLELVERESIIATTFRACLGRLEPQSAGSAVGEPISVRG